MGCTKVSPACDGCYAEALMDKRYGKVQWGPHGERKRTGASTWHDPVRWQKQAEKDGDRPFVFCASLADIFDNQVPAEWRADAFEVMRKTPNLVYLLLTKRPQNIVKLSDAAGGLPRNAALGTTVEDQKRTDINLPALEVAKIETKPLFSFGSFEPLLGPIVIPRAFMPDWIITGGETDQGGHMSRPSHPEWFRDLRDQALDAGSSFHHKQNGEWLAWGQKLEDGSLNFISFGKDPDRYQHLGNEIISKVGKKRSGRTIDGVTWNGFPSVTA
jgi:protein gp37